MCGDFICSYFVLGVSTYIQQQYTIPGTICFKGTTAVVWRSSCLLLFTLEREHSLASPLPSTSAYGVLGDGVLVFHDQFTLFIVCYRGCPFDKGCHRDMVQSYRSAYKGRNVPLL